jgi:upstream activation factor subunit UAF30
MARTTKTSTASSKTESSVPVSAPVVAQVAASAPVASEEKVAKVKKAKAVKTESVAAPVVAAPVVAAAPESSTEDAVETPLAEKSLEFIAKLQQIGGLIASLKTEYRTLEKAWSKELRTSQKTNKKKKRSGNRAPSGFVKPTKISSELASFLEKPEGTEMARTTVTREINAYIRTNLLQDKSNGRKINPDAKLAALLKLGKTDELTYFNLQKFMSPHFAKNVKVVPGAEVAAAV